MLLIFILGKRQCPKRPRVRVANNIGIYKDFALKILNFYLLGTGFKGS